MSDEHFLARWSRRKREAGAAPSLTLPRLLPNPPPLAGEGREGVLQGRVREGVPDAEGKTEAAARRDQRASTSEAADAAPPPSSPTPAVDPANLPSLDSITATTDVRDFLAPDVPAALRREALRRAWSADPAIRDFIGLQEYDWDFTKLDAIHGFAELGPEVDVKRLVAQVFGDVPEDEGKPATEPGAVAVEGDQPFVTTSESAPARGDRSADAALDLSHGHRDSDPRFGTDDPSQSTAAMQHSNELVRRDKDTATQHTESADDRGQKSRRSHGGALPQS
jgi:hypothetical protein